ncbi:MAG: hypothetical protein M0R37_13765 [Bacteroidales bacterium]|jgi:hypothetical protein|nr:hypothetical protein [Bacteroidales bacterium]
MSILLTLIPRKFLYAAVATVASAIMAAVKAKWPSVPLPSAEAILALGGVVIGGHTLTDITAINKAKSDIAAQASKKN